MIEENVWVSSCYCSTCWDPTDCITLYRFTFFQWCFQSAGKLKTRIYVICHLFSHSISNVDFYIQYLAMSAYNDLHKADKGIKTPDSLNVNRDTKAFTINEIRYLNKAHYYNSLSSASTLVKIFSQWNAHLLIHLVFIFCRLKGEFAIAPFNQKYKRVRCLKCHIIPVHFFPCVSMGGVGVPYLAMVLSFVLQHLLQVQAAGQVALRKVVAELRNTEQTLLPAHCFTARKQEYTQHQTQEDSEKHNTCKVYLKVLQAIFKWFKKGGSVGLCNDSAGRETHTELNTNTTDYTRPVACN